MKAQVPLSTPQQTFCLQVRLKRSGTTDMGAKLTLGAAGPNVRFPPKAEVQSGFDGARKRNLAARMFRLA
jgi:hypothetical protein